MTCMLFSAHRVHGKALTIKTEKPAEAGFSILWSKDKVQDLVNG